MSATIVGALKAPTTMGLDIAKSVFQVAVALRQSLIELSNSRGGDEVEQVYQYLTA